MPGIGCFGEALPSEDDLDLDPFGELLLDVPAAVRVDQVGQLGDVGLHPGRLPFAG